ncbi:Gldg family protein [Oscillospiraceae bacterium WX1]
MSNELMKSVKNLVKKLNGEKTAGTKRGMMTAAISAVAVAVAVVFNLVLGSLPSRTLQYDISGKDLYTVSGDTVSYLKGLDKDISIVVLAKEAQLDEHLTKFLKNYAAQSQHLSLKIIDPVLDPTALTTYGAEQNTVVVTCSDTGRSKTLYIDGVDGVQDGLIINDFNTYYSTQTLKPIAIDAEGQLTSAVTYVTSTTSSKIYTLTGHDESGLGANAQDTLEKANITVSSLNLLTAPSIPSDCELVVCVSPEKDLADVELSTLQAYLQNGGHLMLFVKDASFKNFNTLLKAYGLEPLQGTVGDTERYNQQYASYYGQYLFYPVLSTDSDITSSITSDAIVLNPSALTLVTPAQDNTAVAPLLTTSESGVLASGSTSTKGTYIVAAAAVVSPSDGSSSSTRLTVFGGASLIDNDLTSSFTNLSNLDIFLNAVSANLKNPINSVNIPAKSLQVQPVQITHPAIWSVLFLAVIPVGVLVTGLIVWTKRRQR